MDNFKLGRKVVETIAGNFGNFYMGSWIDDLPEEYELNPLHAVDAACDMTACLGGWTMLLSDYTVRDGDFYRPDGTIVDGSLAVESRTLLGMSEHEAFSRPGLGGESDLEVWFDSAHGLERFTRLVEESERQAEREAAQNAYAAERERLAGAEDAR